MRVWRGCAGGPISAAGRHGRGPCAGAGLSGFRRPAGVIFDAGSFASWFYRRVIVVGYDLGREQDWDYVYELFLLAFIVHCVANLAISLYWNFFIFTPWRGRRLRARPRFRRPCRQCECAF